MATWLRRLTRKPKVRTAVGSNPALNSLFAVRNSSPGRPEPCEGNLVAAAGSCGGLMVKHPWPLLEISLSDFCRLATLNIYTYLPTCELFSFPSMMSDSQEIELNAYMDTNDFSPLIESGTSKPSKESVDVLISKVGQCGLYQILVCFIICLTNIPMTYQILIMYFTGHSPNWRCTNVTSTLCNVTKEVSSADVELYHSRCKMPRDNWDYVTPRNFSLITEVE